MTTVLSRHVSRMQKGVAQLRVAAVVLAGGVLWFAGPAGLSGRPGLILGLGIGFLYAVSIMCLEPFLCPPSRWWNGLSCLVDWGLITTLILATGGFGSEFYLLYFFLIVSVAMRYGRRTVLVSGAGTVMGYLAIVLMSAKGAGSGWDEASFRSGYIMLFSLGAAILAHEAVRHLQARVTAEARCRAVEEVTATVSHDLASPFAAIAGLVDLLLGSGAEPLTPEQQLLLRRVSLNAEQGGNLVANLRDVELIEQGRQPFRPALADVNAIVRRVTEAQACQAEAKGIRLEVELDKGLPPALVDDRLIQRLVINLLNNGLKFTPQDGVVRVTSRTHHSWLIIEVWDNGPDVPPALWSSLFEKFARDQSSPGVGLGLYISKLIVDLHHGRIFRRKMGEGVVFVVELPIAPETQELSTSLGRDGELPCGWGPSLGLGVARSA